jgi:putative exporter of polyketide antibiotics
MSFSLWVSTKNRESGKSGMMVAAITLLFYFLFFLGSTWELPVFIQQFNPFFYYQPQKLMFNQNSFVINFSVLIALITMLFIFGYNQFKRRDIP